MDLITPLSSMFPNRFFKMIRAIGPINNPIIPDTLKPVYIAINVNIGWIPMWFPTILGSINCLTIDIKIHNDKIHIAKDMSPLQAEIIDHGIITLPEPNIGNASTKAMPSAYNNGYAMFNPKNLKIYNPIKDIINDINTSTASAFK